METTRYLLHSEYKYQILVEVYAKNQQWSVETTIFFTGIIKIPSMTFLVILIPFRTFVPLLRTQVYDYIVNQNDQNLGNVF